MPHARLVVRGLAALAATGLATTVVLTAADQDGSTAAAATSARANRVLILSLPTLTWADLDTMPAPTLTRLLDGAAIADLATRSDRQPSHLGAAYVTIGAGTRAAGSDETDGDGLEVHERFGRGTAGQAYEQRTGHAAGNGLVNLGIAQILDTNANALFEARPGALGDELAHAGFARAVIANADGSEPDPPSAGPIFVRPAVAALMGSHGRVPGGAVGPELLQRDRTAPFGVRLDPAAVERAFTHEWHKHSVVLVEASDLLRADRSNSFATPATRDTQRRRAIRSSDRLVARLLSHVDPTHDAVIVVAPVPPGGDRSVTVAALRAPGVGPGLLKSATTRRSGFVTLADVAPTVLDILSIDRPDWIEGRPMVVGRDGGTPTDRRAFLVQANADGILRDQLVGPTTTAVGWTTIVLVLGAVLLLGRYAWAADALRWLSLALLGFLLATHVVSGLHLGDHGGVLAFWLFVSLFALAFAGACRRFGRRHPVDPLCLALGALLLVLVGDQLTGGNLEFNAVFGHSATIGIRFVGISNGSFSLLAASAVLLAALLTWRLGSRAGPTVAVLLLGAAFVSLTPPWFGQDFGGTVATAPAFALLAWLLFGRRVTVRFVVGLVGILVASGLVVGFIDLLQPADQRTHVGRFFEKVGDEGLAGFGTVLARKGAQNVGTIDATTSLLVIGVVLVAGALLWWRPPRPLATSVDRIPTLRAAAVALAVVGVLGYVLNDSGIPVPALMLTVVASVMAYLAADVVDRADAGAPAGDRRLATSGRSKQ